MPFCTSSLWSLPRASAALAGLLALFLAIQPAAAQMPSELQREILIKSTLITFNDANITGNYTVMHARLDKRFSSSVTVERLKDAFKSFTQNSIDFDSIVALKPTLTEEPKIDDRNALLLRGYFDARPTRIATNPSRISFVLDYFLSDGEWKLIRINVDVKQIN